MGLQEQFWYFMFEQNNIGDGIISDMTNQMRMINYERNLIPTSEFFFSFIAKVERKHSCSVYAEYLVFLNRI